jgi:hypothetical protein
MAIILHDWPTLPDANKAAVLAMMPMPRIVINLAGAKRLRGKFAAYDLRRRFTVEKAANRPAYSQSKIGMFKARKRGVAREFTPSCLATKGYWNISRYGISIPVGLLARPRNDVVMSAGVAALASPLEHSGLR